MKISPHCPIHILRGHNSATFAVAGFVPDNVQKAQYFPRCNSAFNCLHRLKIQENSTQSLHRNNLATVDGFAKSTPEQLLLITKRNVDSCEQITFTSTNGTNFRITQANCIDPAISTEAVSSDDFAPIGTLQVPTGPTDDENAQARTVVIDVSLQPSNDQKTFTYPLKVIFVPQ